MCIAKHHFLKTLFYGHATLNFCIKKRQAILDYKVPTKFITYSKQIELHYRKKLKLAWK